MHPSSILVDFGSSELMQNVILVNVHFYLHFTECMDGRFGWNCLTPCQKGFYGHLCRKNCECNPYFCDPVKGCNKSSLFSMSSTLDVKNLSYADKGLQIKLGKWNSLCTIIRPFAPKPHTCMRCQVEMAHVLIFNLDRRIGALYSKLSLWLQIK